MLRDDIGGAPCGLKIEPAGYGIYVQNFSCEMQPWVSLAFQSGRIHFAQGHTAACDEFFLKCRAPCNGLFVGGNRGYEFVEGLAAEILPS